MDVFVRRSDKGVSVYCMHPSGMARATYVMFREGLDDKRKDMTSLALALTQLGKDAKNEAIITNFRVPNKIRVGDELADRLVGMMMEMEPDCAVVLDSTKWISDDPAGESTWRVDNWKREYAS